VTVQELHLIKNLTPLWASLVRKRVRAQSVKNENLREGMFIDYIALQFTKLTKHRSGEGCWHSKSALAPCLQC
jgi:hypothetical protein